MLSEILGVIEKTNSRPFLITLITMSMMVKITSGAILVDPITWDIAILPIFGFISYSLVFGWIYMICHINSLLPENDLASWGPIIGSSLMALCLLIAFSYLSVHPQGLGFSLLGQSSFIYICTLFLLSVETTKIRK